MELSSKVAARRNKLLGLWLAEKFGFTGNVADNCLGISEDDVRAKLVEYASVAGEQIQDQE